MTRIRCLLFTLIFVVLLYITQTPDWGGWLLMYASFFLVLLDATIRTDRRLLLAVWATLLLHHSVAVINAFMFTVPGAEYDASSFHISGVENMYDQAGLVFTVGSRFYENLLAFFYIFGGESRLLGQELSILAYTLSCIVLVKYFDLLEIKRWREWLVLLYGMVPSMVIFSSVTLREPFQLLFFMLAIYLGLRTWIQPGKGVMIACITSFLVMGLFHQVLLFYSLFAIVIIMLLPIVSNWINRKRRLALFVSMVIVVTIAYITIPLIQMNPGDDYLKMVKHGPVKALTAYRGGVAKGNPRSAYGIELDDSSYGDLAATIAVLYVHHLFMPFPWQISETKDVVAAFESMLRLMLLVASVIALVRAGGIQIRTFGILLVFYVSLTFLWSLGTTNYGQGIRHHVLTNWILIVIGGPGLIVFLRTVSIRTFQRRCFSWPK